MTNSAKTALLGLDQTELRSLMESMGESAYRAKQISEAVYRQRVDSIDQISTLSQALRSRLSESGVAIGLPTIEKRFESQDGTVRYSD